jgi:hypothetical protein
MLFFDWDVPYAGSLEISLGNGLYDVLVVRLKLLYPRLFALWQCPMLQGPLEKGKQRLWFWPEA